MIVKALTGETLTAETWFRDTSGQPIIPVSGGASYAIRDFNRSLVASGAGTQDGGDPSRWYSTIVIPAGSPISSTGQQKYSLVWQIQSAGGLVTSTEYFDVYPATDPIHRVDETDILHLEGTPFYDSLRVETLGLPSVTSVSYGIVNDVGTTVKPIAAVSQSSSDGSTAIYGFTETEVSTNLPDLAVSNQVLNYMGVWTVSRGAGNVEIQIHPIYTINFYMYRHLDSLQKLVDRARIGDTQPHLKITGPELIHHLFRGIEYVASAPPNVATPISPSALPGALSDFIIKAGAVSLLKAMYLSEGMTNFDFQGLGVQLMVDRTQYIDNMISRLEADLGEPLRTAKNLWIRAGSPTGPAGSTGGARSPFYNSVGVLNVSVGSYSNVVSAGYIPFIGPYFGPTQLWRGFSPINGFGG